MIQGVFSINEVRGQGLRSMVIKSIGSTAEFSSTEE